MVWFVESILGHFQTDVIDPAFLNLLARVEKGRKGEMGEGGDEILGEGGRRSRNQSERSNFEDEGTTFGTEARGEREREKNRRDQLDFSSIETLHELYLRVLHSGLLLDSDVLSGKVTEMLDTCEELCGKVERWGGDILPGLLSGSLDEEEDAQGKRGSRLLDNFFRITDQV